MNTINTDVIIIGAGPTGLSLACQFIRYGIDFVVVEKNETVTPFSKAIGVQARTLEIYDQIGLAKPAIERGMITDRICLLEGGEVRGEMELADLGAGLSQFPFMLMLEQSRNEELLYDFVQRHNGEVLWKTELESFTQDQTGVTAQIKRASGESHTIKAKYLVGCDGASSAVRHGLGLTFEGSTFERLFYVADTRVDWDLPYNTLYVALARDVFTAFFPMPGEHHYRIIGTFPESKNQEEQGEVVYEEIEREIKERAKLSLEISDVRWFSLYKVHSRRVNKFSEGRCFLAGDSAHIHSPAGAQGMNTGIQDAYNLAWKLALVINGHATERLLETYNEERLANAKRLLDSTDRMFEFAAGSHWLMSLFRTVLFPSLAGFMTSVDAIRTRLFTLISQIGINYRDASLSEHTDDERDVKAGDRLPYFQVDGQSIFDKLKEPKFHLLLFSRREHEEVCKEFLDQFGNLADCHVIPLSERVTEIFETEEEFSVFLRPDNHIAFISSEIPPGNIAEYLQSRNISEGL